MTRAPDGRHFAERQDHEDGEDGLDSESMLYGWEPVAPVERSLGSWVDIHTGAIVYHVGN